MKWKEKISRNRRQLAVLILVLLVQCFYISQKDGYHMDELLTFELANAEYNPWIVPTQPVGRLAKFMQQEIYADTLGETFGNLKDTVADVLQNRGSSKLLSYQADVYEEPVWITREQFHEYITVGERDGFNYLSVYFNVKDDNHPPLYFMMVHTMSSIFREKISPWMGCIFNLAAVMGCCIVMYALGRLLIVHHLLEEKNGERWGLFSALLYGCSSGAIATTVFIRMYGVMTFLCMLSLYLHLQKWLGGQSQEGKNFSKKNKLLILVTALGFWTQYFFLFYCLLLALVTVIVLFRESRKRETFCYIRSMVIAALVGVGIYPFGVKHILTSGRGVEAIDNLLGGLSGYGERLLTFGGILLQRTFGQNSLGLAVMILLLLTTGILLFRSRHKTAVSQSDNGVRRKLWWMLALPPLGYFLLAAKMSPYMVDRYIMPVFPYAAMAVAGLLVYLFHCLGSIDLSFTLCITLLLTTINTFANATFPNSIVRTFIYAVMVIGLLAYLYHRLGPTAQTFSLYILLLLCMVNIFTYDGEYLYKGYSTQLSMSREYADTPCICVYEGYGFYDNLLEFENYERTLLVKPSELADRQDISELPEVIILLKQNARSESYEEVLEILAGYGLKQDHFLFRGSGVYGDMLLYYVNESLN